MKPLWRKVSLIINVLALGLLVLSGFLNVIDKAFGPVALSVSLAVGGVNSWISYRETKKKFHLFEAVISGVVVCAALVIVVAYSGKNPSVVSSEVNAVEMMVYPWEGPHFHIEDSEIVGEIVDEINGLSKEKSTERPEKISDNYFYFELHGGKETVTVELDESCIMLGQTYYEADCTQLCEQLYQVCSQLSPKNN